MAAADLDAAHVDDGGLLVELAVRLFDRLADARDALDDGQALEHLDIDFADVADDGVELALRNVAGKPHALEPFAETVALLRGGAVFQDCDHAKLLLKKSSKPSRPLRTEKKQGRAAILHGLMTPRKKLRFTDQLFGSTKSLFWKLQKSKSNSIRLQKS